MAYTLSHKSNANWEALTQQLDCFFAAFRFDVDAANSQLTVGNGIFAALVTSNGAPANLVPPGPADRTLKIDGGDGVGSLVFDGLLPATSYDSEVVNQFATLFVFGFDPTSDRSSWLNADGWGPRFKDPLANVEHIESTLSHHIAAGDSPARWAHRVTVRRQNKVNTALTAMMPMLAGPVATAILARHTAIAAHPRYMPALEVTTKYGTGLEHDWHFFEVENQELNSRASGLAMAATGRLQSLLLSTELSWWLRALNVPPDNPDRSVIDDAIVASALGHPDLRPRTVRAPTAGSPELPLLGDGHLELLYIEGDLGNQPVFRDDPAAGGH